MHFIPSRLLILFSSLWVSLTHAQELSIRGYASIQAALDENPNQMLYVPSGDHRIREKIRIRGEHAGLFGPGRIVQENAGQPIIEIEGAVGAQVRDLILTRSQGAMETQSEGIIAMQCRDLVISQVQVIDNHSRSAAMALRNCEHSQISHCLIRNYMRISQDDRTHNMDWGYAFHCTDGSGISVSHSRGTLIEGNRIIESILLPTPEIRAQHKLGDFVKKNPVKGNFISQDAWDRGYTDNWQQGSGLIVTAPEVSELTRILGNHIENAAQGIDLHTDRVIVANNIVINSFIGMKAMHGSRNVLITGNQFHRNSLWAIGLMPGAAAHAKNKDGGSIIANNIISDFGHGDAHWIWGDERSPFKFDIGQQADDPPLTDVIIQGNMVHHEGPSRYKYAVIIARGANTPHGMHFSNNVLPAGALGIANTDLPP